MVPNTPNNSHSSQGTAPDNQLARVEANWGAAWKRHQDGLPEPVNLLAKFNKAM
jgi:hypothetical protein